MDTAQDPSQSPEGSTHTIIDSTGGSTHAILDSPGGSIGIITDSLGGSSSHGTEPLTDKDPGSSSPGVIDKDCTAPIDTPSFTGLHEIYRHCVHPLDLYKQTVLHLAKGFPINYVDETGGTVVSLLVLHINRGLRYNMYRIPQLAELEDINAASSEITQRCVEIDRDYQEQVYKSLVLLLNHGADCNIIPGTCPGIPYDLEWSENYEHKIMQSDQRWNLFTVGGSMEFTTYSIFNPLSRYHPTNGKGVSTLHLAAWRGDAQCLRLLIQHGVDVHAVTNDNRNALHFLYLYCNKPEDITNCTMILVQNGIDVNAIDANGRTPLLVLLNHFLVKNSHVKYLANCYTDKNVMTVPSESDNFCDVVKQSALLLIESGAKVEYVNHNMEMPLHHIYNRFEHSLRNCEAEFQIKGHYLVPYNFTVTPLIEFSRFLVRVGCQVNSRDCLGRTPLHRLVMALRNLSLDENLNSTEAVCDCFLVLLEEGANVNIKDYVDKTAFHHLVEVVCTTRHALKRHLPAMKLLVSYGTDLRSQDSHGLTVLHAVLGSNMRAEHMQQLLIFLLQCGADPNQTNHDHKYPLNNLMRQHIHHHDPLSMGRVSLCLDSYLRTVDIVCSTMSLEALGYIFSVYRESGFWGVICESECRVYRLLERHCQSVRSLKHECRLRIKESMGGRFWKECEVLPLPTEIKQYLLQLV